jgi:phage shock protein C
MTDDSSYGPGRIHRLYRNPQRGMIFGVCAGLAEHFGFDVTITRVLVVVAGFFSAFMIGFVYLLLGMLLPTRSQESGRHDAVDPVEREVKRRPHDTLSNVRYRFRDLDTRLARLEKYVTSNRFKLDREFRALKD